MIPSVDLDQPKDKLCACWLYASLYYDRRIKCTLWISECTAVSRQNSLIKNRTVYILFCSRNITDTSPLSIATGLRVNRIEMNPLRLQVNTEIFYSSFQVFRQQFYLFLENFSWIIPSHHANLKIGRMFKKLIGNRLEKDILTD